MPFEMKILTKDKEIIDLHEKIRNLPVCKECDGGHIMEEKRWHFFMNNRDDLYDKNLRVDFYLDFHDNIISKTNIIWWRKMLSKLYNDLIEFEKLYQKHIVEKKLAKIMRSGKAYEIG